MGQLRGKFKYNLANWALVSQKKEYGGLGIPNLVDLNLCLLASWVKRYKIEQDKIWRQIIEFKYNHNVDNPIIFSSTELDASPFLEGGCSGLQKRIKLVIGGKLGMVGRLNFGRITGLGVLAWQSSTGKFM